MILLSDTDDEEVNLPIERNFNNIEIENELNSSRFHNSLSKLREYNRKVTDKEIEYKNKTINIKFLILSNKVIGLNEENFITKRKNQKTKTYNFTSKVSVLNKTANKENKKSDVENSSKIKTLNSLKRKSYSSSIEENILEIPNKKRNESKRNIMSLYDYHNSTRPDDIGVSSSSTNIGYNNITSKSNDDNTVNNQYFIPPNHLSMATLCNIGNTCYLNSVVYTLRFAPIFLHNLHHLVEDLNQIINKMGNNRIKSSSLGRNVGGLVGQSSRSWSNKDLASFGNNIGCDISKNSRQIATEKLHELYQNLHRNEMIENIEPFHADTFLQAIQDVNSIFEGNQQQDAHEFLMCILDSIRETCQYLTKIIYDSPEVFINGYVSVPEQSEVTSTQPSKVQKPSFFFKKLKKTDKTKSKKPPDSPLKDQNCSSAVTSNGMINTSKVEEIPSNKTIVNGIENDNNIKTDQEKLNEKIKELGLHFFSEDFEGITVSSTKCLSCETVTEQKESMIDIAVPISEYEDRISIDNPDLFFQNSIITTEYFKEENKYRCEQCFGYTEAIRSISYEVLPRLLIVQLKRFSGGMEKISSYRPTPLELKCFCVKCLRSNDYSKNHKYKLYGVITHVGATMSVGHYVAYTCSLDLYKDYVNCSKDFYKKQQNFKGQTQLTSNGSNEKNTGKIKKMIFQRSKASSSGDVTKNLKNNLNGVMNKLVNSSEKFINYTSNSSSASSSFSSSSTTSVCQGIKCCGINCESIQIRNGGGINILNGGTTTINDLNDDNLPDSNYNNAVNHLNYSNSNNHYNKNAHNSQEPIWYMCDDDKIKAMSRQEFEELLSPNNKVTITPYILFYARINNE